MLWHVNQVWVGALLFWHMHYDIDAIFPDNSAATLFPYDFFARFTDFSDPSKDLRSPKKHQN